MSFTTDHSKEELVKIAEYHYAKYNDLEECREAIEKDVQFAMKNSLDLHEWEEYTVKPHAKNF
jgi:aromatic ring-cleaving dioxygenase